MILCLGGYIDKLSSRVYTKCKKSKYAQRVSDSSKFKSVSEVNTFHNDFISKDITLFHQMMKINK
jgi:hypothetical protein